MAKALAPRYREQMGKMEINAAIKEIWQLIGRANKYIDETEPWILAKDPAKAAAQYSAAKPAGSVGHCIGSGRAIYPDDCRSDPLTAWPGAGGGAWRDGAPRQFRRRRTISTRTPDRQAGAADFSPDRGEDGGSPGREAGKPTGKAAGCGCRASQDHSRGRDRISAEITIDDFAKLDLRTAKVTAAEKVEKPIKLPELTVDLGSEQRTIVSGISQYYSPEDMVSRTVIMQSPI